MGERSVDVVFNTIVFLLLFYTMSYAFAGISCGIFNVEMKGYLPFEHHHSFRNNRGSAAWANMVASFLVFSVCLGVYFPHHVRLWDYFITLALLHLMTTSIVTLSFPMSGLWWGTIVVLVVLQLVLSRIAQSLTRKGFPPREE
eukprot:m.93362 g.93362  ORF g.93362 m.93362 type:complete len:143 (+) comp8910_c0_seq2:58-486(+)